MGAEAKIKSLGITLPVPGKPLGNYVPGVYEVSDFFDKYVTPGQFDIVPFSWIGTPFPISSTKSIYAKPMVGPTGELQIRQNYGPEPATALGLPATFPNFTLRNIAIH